MPPSRFAWITIITLFTGCPRKGSDANRPSASIMGAPADTEERVAAEAAPPGAVQIVLLDAGKGPRQPLVHELAPGAYDCVMRFSFESTVEANTPDGQSMLDDMDLPPLPTIRLLYKARLEPDDVPSRLRFSTTIFDVSMDAPSNPFEVEILRELKSAMIGQKSVVSMTTNGSEVDVLKDHGMPEGMPPSLSLADHARDRHILFPPEPVGIGARWQVITRELDTEGMAAELLSVYTLTERTEHWITVNVDTEMELFDDPTKAAIDDMTAMIDDTAQVVFDDIDVDIQETMSEFGMHIGYSKLRSHGTLRTSLTSLVVEGHETFEMDTTVQITTPDGPTERIESHDVFKLEMTARKVGAQ